MTTLANNILSPTKGVRDVFRVPYGDWVTIGLPLFFLLISIGSFIWFFVEVKKQNLRMKTMSVWFTLNFLYLAFVIYTFITAILQAMGVFAPNIFALLAYYAFGLELNKSMEWIFIWIFGFISWLTVKSLHNSIKIGELNDKIEQLNEEVSFLAGKVNKSAKFEDVPVMPRYETKKEIVKNMKNDIYVEKLKAKANKKLSKIHNKSTKKG